MKKITISEKEYNITDDAYYKMQEYKNSASTIDYERLGYIIELDISAILNTIDLEQVNEGIKILEDEKIVVPTIVDKISIFLKKVWNYILDHEKLQLSIMLLISGFWGFFQTTIFPVEKFGGFFLITCIIGGGLIGYGFGVFFKYFKKKRYE